MMENRPLNAGVSLKSAPKYNNQRIHTQRITHNNYKTWLKIKKRPNTLQYEEGRKHVIIIIIILIIISALVKGKHIFFSNKNNTVKESLDE